MNDTDQLQHLLIKSTERSRGFVVRLLVVSRSSIKAPLSTQHPPHKYRANRPLSIILTFLALHAAWEVCRAYYYLRLPPIQYLMPGLQTQYNKSCRRAFLGTPSHRDAYLSTAPWYQPRRPIERSMIAHRN